ncbi:hypothetical protein SteCoe_20047 [Stentor coeruleus]|uniref:Uncharacterized protein n=1 Tax=Stentor coeruleus TaxID=5963 RepID=A0A1R2BSX1_9CILI|nr:hypothetical protein SteCoe_20047 [Stentor coeruleus]
MASNFGEFSFSPRSLHNPYQSLSCFRSTEDIHESYTSTPRNIIEHLELKKERHEALKNYYLTVLSQLKDFLKVSLQQLDEQKTTLIDEIELKYREAVKDVKRRALKKEQELNEKLEEAVMHFDQVTTLIKKLEVMGNDKNLVREAEENLKVWAREVEVSSNNLMFPVPTLTVSTSEYSEFKSLSRYVQISSLVSEESPLHGQCANKTKLYVPFGLPEYYYYYFVSISSQISCQSLIAALLPYFNLESASLSYKNPPVAIPINEKISPNTKELYLILIS